MKASQERWEGPTAERLIQSNGHLEVGGEKGDARVYRFNDTALARVYGRLKANARTEDQRAISEREERALERYFTAYVEGGMLGNVSSVDCNRTGSSSPAGRDHAAKTAWQIDHRDDFNRANITLSENQRTVLKIVVLAGGSLEDAGRAMGKMSKTRALQCAERILRDGGSALVELWKI